MSLTSCMIRFTSKVDHSMYATPSLLKLLQLHPGDKAAIQFGQRKAQIRVRRMRGSGKELYLSDNIKRALEIPYGGGCQVTSPESGLIRIGPLIGVLTSSGPAGVSAPFGSRTGMIRELLRVGQGSSYYFAFRPKDIDWHNETVIGYFARPSGGFVRRSVPLPDVVYNRLPSRRAEKTETMEQFKERFTKRKIPIFNWSFFEKWDVYRLLEGSAASQYVPESYMNPNSARIKEMLEKHQFVYLKPTGGSLGHGIFRLTYHPSKGYFCRFRLGSDNILLRFRKFNDLYQRVKRGGRMKNYVIQQGIRLIELDKCPIDFRFHMNKNADNEWVAAGIGAKRAGRGSVTTHIKNGGKLMTPEVALSRIYGSTSKAEEMLEKAKKAAIQLAESIERAYPHRLGELGFDIGIDQKDNIWMFEANAKPGRSIFKHPSLRAQGKETLRHIFEYCQYLSRFRERREG